MFRTVRVFRAIRVYCPDPQTLQSARKLVISGAYLNPTETLRETTNRRLGTCTAFASLPLTSTISASKSTRPHRPSPLLIVQVLCSSSKSSRPRRPPLPPPSSTPSAFFVVGAIRLPPFSSSAPSVSRLFRRRRHPSPAFFVVDAICHPPFSSSTPQPSRHRQQRCAHLVVAISTRSSATPSHPSSRPFLVNARLLVVAAPTLSPPSPRRYARTFYRCSSIRGRHCGSR